jgi:hypothetical protein
MLTPASLPSSSATLVGQGNVSPPPSAVPPLRFASHLCHNYLKSGERKGARPQSRRGSNKRPRHLCSRSQQRWMRGAPTDCCAKVNISNSPSVRS